MRVTQAGTLLLIAGLVVGCSESSTDLDQSVTPAFHKGGKSGKSHKSGKSSTTPPTTATILVGTTGFGGTLSTLIEIDPVTGATLDIGPVGFAVNGLEFDPTTGTLFGTTSKQDPAYTGLITIDLTTGAGTPVSASSGFGLGNREVVNNITIDASGQLFGWWEPVEDDLVRIDKTTGLATLVGESDPVFTGSAPATAVLTSITVAHCTSTPRFPPISIRSILFWDLPPSWAL